MTETRLKDNTYLSAEQQEKRQAQKEEKSNDKQILDTVEVGDRFRHKITGEVSEVVSLTGALPFYTDDCTVTTDKGSYAATENISYDKLLNSDLYEYIVRAEPEKENVKVEGVPETEKSDIPTVKNLSQLKKTIKPGMIGDIEYTDRKEAAKALESAALAIKYADTPVKVGLFQGFDLTITMNSGLMGSGMTACMRGAASHPTKLIESFAHNLNRIESALYNIDGRIESTKENLAKLRIDHTEAQKIVAEPFPQQAELETKEERLKELTTALNLAAIETKKNAPKREQTYYFERAKMKRDAMRIAKQKPKQSKDKGKDKKKPALE